MAVRTAGDGRRCSAATAYLRPALRRPNLKVVVEALATRVLFEGSRAVGVEWLEDPYKAARGAQLVALLTE